MTTPTIPYRVHSIKYDADDPTDLAGLPDELIIQVEVDDEDPEQTVSDAISDQTGFCHAGFCYEKIR